MAAVLAANWWAIALRGIVSILFAILTFTMPGMTLAVLVMLFGVYALVDGVFAIVSTIRAVQGHRRWGTFLAEGIIGISLGLFAFAAPIAFAASLIYLVAAWAVITGVLELVAASRLRRHVQGEWTLILVGVLSICFGVAAFWAPVFGALAIVVWLGVYALVFGVLLLSLAFRLRAHGRSGRYIGTATPVV
ncbi:MAG: HdeD family acid-resistance protein [Rhodospirillales bacterium]|nr:HdeD family acid-resistance protein [Acetobacter sp.]